MYIETSVCCSSYSELWGYSWSADCSASVSGVCGSGHNPDCLLRVVSIEYFEFMYHPSTHINLLHAI